MIDIDYRDVVGLVRRGLVALFATHRDGRHGPTLERFRTRYFRFRFRVEPASQLHSSELVDKARAFILTVIPAPWKHCCNGTRDDSLSHEGQTRS
jgi:hypothetical protein